MGMILTEAAEGEIDTMACRDRDLVCDILERPIRPPITADMTAEELLRYEEEREAEGAIHLDAAGGLINGVGDEPVDPNKKT